MRCDALIVGGGPAGSACAGALARANWNVVVADRARFPRDKVCAGWITPEVLSLLRLTPAEYRSAGLTIQEIAGFETCVIGGPAIRTAYGRAVSYAIRRCEFDDFLLRRSGARVLDGTAVSTLRRNGGRWIVNGEIETPVIVGAGGHFCPVARFLQGRPDTDRPVVAKEAEFRVDQNLTKVVPEIPELFFCRDLEGYGWCVRKGEYLNVGIGRRDGTRFARHLDEFARFLAGSRRAPEIAGRLWRGHAYHAMGAGLRPIVADGAVVIGDAAGLAYPESGEGIRPAIESGLLAAQALVASGGRFDAAALAWYEAAIRARHRPARRVPRLLRPAVRLAGRALLGHSAAFTRRMVIEKWFLRAGGSPGIPAAQAAPERLR